MHYRRCTSEKTKEIKNQQIWNLSPINPCPHIQEFSFSSTNFIQWNSQGIANENTELLDLIAKEKPDVLCIQKTIIPKQTNFKLKYYIGVFKEGHINYWAHWGVVICIYQNLTLNSPIQAIAATINIERDVTIVSIYKSRSHDISKKLLSTLFQQLTQPVISKGDFNSYLKKWRNPVNNNRGHPVLNFINKNQINIFNDGRHTNKPGTSKLAINFFTTYSVLQCHR